VPLQARPVALVCLVLAGCAAPRPGQPIQSEEAAQPSRPVPQPGWLQIEAKADIPADVRADLVQRIERAFEFTLALHHFSHPDEVRNQPLVVTVRPSAARDSSASTHGPGTMQIDVGALDEGKIDGTLAHELSHLMDLRVLASSPFEVPRYLHEGKALAVGQRYRATTGALADDVARGQLLARLDGNQVEQALQRFRSREDQSAAKDAKLLGRFMAVGVFFVEFVRIHYCEGRGEVIALLAQTFERVGGGAALDAAFEQSFGISLTKAEQAFVAFARATEGIPSERLKGTFYEGLKIPR
jgi:hypothetical protein